ncbi:MAG: hypothetical protein ACTSQQ_00730 [Candidatus Helarchaeota archaeon]
MSRRRQRKEEKEELQKHKKALKKSYQKKFAGKKRIGTKKLTDTQKWGLIVGVTLIIIMIVGVQFFKPPSPLISYTEGDFIYANLDQNTQNISFKRIIAYHYLKPRNTKISCDIDDYFDQTFNYQFKTLPETISATTFSNYTHYEFIEEKSVISFATTMENGTELDMSSWVDLVGMTTNPSAIPSGVPTLVNFSLHLKTTVAVSYCNISLTFNKTLADTTLEYYNIENGSADEENLVFFVEDHNLEANSLITLDFTLNITTTASVSKLNLLESGESHLVLNDKLLKDFVGYSNFKEASINLAPYYPEGEPSIEKHKFLDVVINSPDFYIDIS